MASTDLPVSIERQLLALDRQFRDVAFGRGISRLALCACLSLAVVLAADWFLGLDGTIRLCFLLGWAALTVTIAWSQVLVALLRPTSFAELAALVEKQHPELKERLTSLVELREHDAAPGASRLMRDLLVRQTSKAVERLDLTDVAPMARSAGTAFAGVMSMLLVLIPFLFFPSEYGLLWARLFAPWGNFTWGSVVLVVVDGDRVVARGSDVPIQIEVQRRSSRASDADDEKSQLWLHWTDADGATDSRRLEWDAETRRFAATLPHVFKSLEFHAAMSGARSERHRIEVADPPAITRLQLDVEPPAYTGLPARTLDGAQGEVRASERSRIVMKLEFSEPVTTAELLWPVPAESGVDVSLNEPKPTQRSIRLKLASDKQSATVEALAISSGAFVIQLKNKFGLTNDDPQRALLVDRDLPPAMSLEGTDEPVAVRPDDRYVVKAQLRDDYGLTDVELHLESSIGKKRVDAVPAETLRERAFSHQFPIDLSDFELKPGDAVTYRVRAVDNRPVPQPQETWTRSRTLMIESKASTPVDQELAEREQDVKEQIADLREDLAKTKDALEKLHQQTEKESLKQQNSDKSEKIAKLEQQQAELSERLHQLAAELAERQLTEKLAVQAQQLADRDLADAQKRLADAKLGESRDQLQPLSESIDKLAGIDKQLRSMEQQLTELSRLEQDLAQLDRLALNSERLAEKLDQLDRQSKQAAEPPAKTGPAAPSKTAEPNDTPADASPQVAENASAPPKSQAELEAERKKLEAEGQKLSQELTDLLKKHPELLDAARRDQLQQLGQLAEQASELAKPQQQLAESFKQAAEDASKAGDMPADGNPPGDKPSPAPETPANESNPATTPTAGDTPKDDQANASPESKERAAQAEAAAEVVKGQQQLAQEATRQALDLAQQEGPESKATQAATDFAKQAAEAARKAQAGQLDQASQQAKAAAQSAEQAARELAQAEQPVSKQAGQASQLAERQQRLADQMQQLAPSKPAQQGAQQQGQKQLADATGALAKQLEQAAKNLGASPLNSKQESQAASQAQQSVEEAQQAMKQAAEAAKSNDAQSASQQAARASEKLQQAAQQAQATSPPQTSNQSVPEELATRVAQASQQLQQAQEQLSSSNLNKPDPAGSKPASSSSQPGEKTSPSAAIGDEASGAQPSDPSGGGEGPKPGSESSSQGQGAPGKPGEKAAQSTPTGDKGLSTPSSGEPGSGEGAKPGSGSAPHREPSLADVAEKFRQAASSMRRAVQGDGDQPSDKPGQQLPGQNQAQSQEPNESLEPGQPGGNHPGSGTAQAEADLKKLDLELKKQGQRNWGRLPGQLKTEILQGASKKPRPEYARQIKSYFEEIAKPATKGNSP